MASLRKASTVRNLSSSVLSRKQHCWLPRQHSTCSHEPLNLDEEITIRTTRRNLAYVHGTLGNCISFLHNDIHYPGEEKCLEFAKQELNRIAYCYYKIVRDMCPADLREAIEVDSGESIMKDWNPVLQVVDASRGYGTLQPSEEEWQFAYGRVTLDTPVNQTRTRILMEAEKKEGAPLKVAYCALSTFVWGKRGLDVVDKHFGKDNVYPIAVPWPLSQEDKRRLWNQLEGLRYDYLISFWNGLYLRPKDFKKASLGAINVHPAPPEHPGLGMFSYPRVFPDKRSHHGVTIHEINAKFDNGTIYRAERFDILPRIQMTDTEFALKTGYLSLDMLDECCAHLATTGALTSTLARPEGPQEQWGQHYFSGLQEEEWLKTLSPDDPAHHLGCEHGRLLLHDLGAPSTSMDRV